MKASANISTQIAQNIKDSLCETKDKALAFKLSQTTVHTLVPGLMENSMVMGP